MNTHHPVSNGGVQPFGILSGKLEMTVPQFETIQMQLHQIALDVQQIRQGRESMLERLATIEAQGRTRERDIDSQTRTIGEFEKKVESVEDKLRELTNRVQRNEIRLDWWKWTGASVFAISFYALDVFDKLSSLIKKLLP